jgi:hypothetical protein
MDTKNKRKNIKISEKHHEMLKQYCDRNGIKMYKILEKMIEDKCKLVKSKDLYGE